MTRQSIPVGERPDGKPKDAAASIATERQVAILRGHHGEPDLMIRHAPGPGPSVVYVHGATFPSGLSVAYRFAGRSWMDDLASRGFDVWAFDFPGFGGSQRPTCFDRSMCEAPPNGRAPEAVQALARVVEHVVLATGRAKLSLIAHSWGTLVAGLYASRRPDRIARVVLFGPIVRREPSGQANPVGDGAWRLVSVAAQRARFVEGVPPGHDPLPIEPELANWGPAYLASDPGAAERRPEPAVKVPSGPRADNLAAWSGEFAYEPADVIAPTAIVRGEWDSLCTDADARWLLERLGASEKRDIKLPKGTHLMHLEQGRDALFDATAQFLRSANG